MQTGQEELAVLWASWVERFSGRRVVAALSFLLIPLIGIVGWRVEGPALGITAATGVLACFLFLLAFAMARRELASWPSPTKVPAVPMTADLEPVPLAEVDGEPTSGSGSVGRLAS